MDRETAIAKIKKCLALAQSSNANEAASAMRQAQKLMEMHGLNGIDVELSDVSEKSTEAHSNMLPAWEMLLAQVVATAFGCTHYINHGLKKQFMAAPKRTTGYVFVGVNPSSDIAAYAFRVLQRQCVADRLAHVREQNKRLKSSTRSGRGDAFALAWVRAVASMVQDFAGGEERSQLLLKYIELNHPGMRTVEPQRRDLNRFVRDESHAAGTAAGSRARLHRGVGPGKKQEMLK